jgi:hypothetical protein
MKRLDAPYLPGVRSAAWVKHKHRRRENLVVTGWVPASGTAYLAAAPIPYPVPAYMLEQAQEDAPEKPLAGDRCLWLTARWRHRYPKA